jgi:hypothetical protein
MVALLVLAIHFYFTDTFFLISAKAEGISSQFLVLSLFVLFFTLSSFITYITNKRNLAEHLVLTVYSTSFWTIIFVPLLLVNIQFFNNDELQIPFFISYIMLIMVWNNFVFEMPLLKRLLMIFLNAAVLISIILVLYFVLLNFTDILDVHLEAT